MFVNNGFTTLDLYYNLAFFILLLKVYLLIKSCFFYKIFLVRVSRSFFLRFTIFLSSNNIVFLNFLFLFSFFTCCRKRGKNQWWFLLFIHSYDVHDSKRSRYFPFTLSSQCRRQDVLPWLAVVRFIQVNEQHCSIPYFQKIAEKDALGVILLYHFSLLKASSTSSLFLHQS